ncbi:DUF3499 domain-containing protein [Corynebacterium spheniscorum]|uniref:DUF3499 domain-containing protein n=1 Tax=Corynebacterium spheniscorum TaxID=185761 RepID=A0A1I2Q1W7_9CORY|nr:DUF3499 domain-containing protein [Corynebacterium spheniscorum]KAA8723457.1 DUF3499 domain-containing protein [Corynebacterium spheniscorum]SFG19631.1 Protein of unknown function [Corynebacterium spheniscorum]
MSQFRRCSRPACGKPAVATLTYAYAESTAVVGPLAPQSDPHSWDLCEEHAQRITAPLGWEMLRVDTIQQDDDDDLTALAEAVREAGLGPQRHGSGLMEPHDFQATPDPGRHPVYRERKKEARRAHLRLIRTEDLED